MKAKIVMQVRQRGIEDVVGYAVKWLLVEDAKGLVITSDNDELSAFTGSNANEGKVVGEVEVSNELVEKALAFVRAKDEFSGFKRVFEALIG
jgi:hypothetical protein